MTWLGTKPVSCQLCKASFDQMFFDVNLGRGWGFVCIRCFIKNRCRLGTGLGRAYDLRTRKKLELAEDKIRADYEASCREALKSGKCSECKDGFVKYTGDIAAPGYGQRWKCNNCKETYIKVGTRWYVSSAPPELTEAVVR